MFPRALVLALSLAASLAALASLYPPFLPARSRPGSLPTTPREGASTGPQRPQGAEGAKLLPLPSLARNASSVEAKEVQRANDGAQEFRQDAGDGPRGEPNKWLRVPIPVRRLLQSQLLNESPLSRLIWKAWEVQSAPAVVGTRAAAAALSQVPSNGQRSQAKSTQARGGGGGGGRSGGSLGRLFRSGGDEPASEAGLSEQGLEPVKAGAGQAVFSDEHSEDLVEALPDTQDAPGDAGGAGAGPGKGGAGGGGMPEVDQDGGIAEAADVAKPHMHTEGSPGEQDSPLVFSKRQQQESVKDLAGFSTIDASLPMIKKYSVLVDSYLTPWTRIPGVEQGMGATGMISPQLLQAMGKRQFIMACCGHVRIVDGKIYYRYGRFFYSWYRMMRLLQTIKILEDTVRVYKLQALRVEFFLNTCDLPMSFDSSMGRERGGYPVFSTEWVRGSIDILYPDPLDLSEDYYASERGQVPWLQKVPRAFFRGSTTNYILRNDTNWRASPRLRLHRMSQVRPDLLDAQVMRWSHANERSTKKMIEEDGVRMGTRVSNTDAAVFKYSLVVDGGGGSCRTCSALSGDQLMIKHSSSFQQFYQPLLRPFVHYIPTEHYFGDLYKRIEWARTHDTQCRNMVVAANRLAKWACTWSGRALYWAVLLIKYSKNAMADPSAVRHPPRGDVCHHTAEAFMMVPQRMKADPKAHLPPENWPPLCDSQEVGSVLQPKCAFYCDGDVLPEKELWLTSKAVRKIPRIPLEKLKTA